MANGAKEVSSLVASDLPKGITLLADMTTNINSVTASVKNLVEKINNGDLNTDQGLSLLELKNNAFLSYLCNLSYTTLLKLSGISFKNKPSIERLVELRVLLERIRPLENKLKHQIDRYMQAPAAGKAKDADSKDDLNNVADSDSSEDEDGQEKRSAGGKDEKLYKIPRVSQVAYPGEEEKTDARAEREKRRAHNSTMLQDALYEHTDDPEIVHNSNTLKQKSLEKRQMIQRYEEDNFTRLQLSKKDRAALTQITTPGNFSAELLAFRSLDSLQGKLAGGTKRKRSSGRKGKGRKGFKKNKR